jgi:Fungal N-terminal domain of STAND proteins
MAEPISISSGIAGLLTLAITVADKSYQYASDVRGASATVASYLQELSAMKAILFKLNELTETHAATARLAKASTSLLSAMNINECQKELEMILGKLRKHSEGSALSALAWPFVERDIKKHVGMLQRYNHLFQMALSADA